MLRGCHGGEELTRGDVLSVKGENWRGGVGVCEDVRAGVRQSCGEGCHNEVREEALGDLRGRFVIS